MTPEEDGESSTRQAPSRTDPDTKEKLNYRRARYNGQSDRDGLLMGGLLGSLGGLGGARQQWRAGRACFVEGTPLLTPGGCSRAIESIVAGMRVLSRSEHDADGPVEARAVEEVFARYSAVLWLVVGGRRVGTTAEHPFWVPAAGAWVPAGELRAGDGLVGHDGQAVAVEAVEDGGEWTRVYNLRVAEYHTYFVGSAEWGFSVWAHNAECGDLRVNAKTGQLQELRPSNGGKGPLRWQNAEPKPAASVTGQKTLYHYTNEAGEQGINASKQLRPSTLANNPRDVRYGNGQYLTDIAPGTMTPAELSRAFIGQPFQGRRFTNYVEVDITGLNLIKGRYGVFVVPNNKSLDLNGRIVGSGAN